MASELDVNNKRKQIEGVVKKWLVDFYSFLALDSFKNEHYSEFSNIKDFLGSVLLQAVISSEIKPARVLILQFLSSINEGSNCRNESIKQLETALLLLERIGQLGEVSLQDLKNVSTLIQKMIVKICIKNMELDRAMEMAHKYFSNCAANSSEEMYFQSLISLRRKGENLDEDIHFGEFKHQMMEFCETFWKFTPPFLYKAAVQLSDKLGEIDATSSSDTEFSNYKHGMIQKSRLEKAYLELAGESNIPFSQLEDEVESGQSLNLRLSPSDVNDDDEQEQAHPSSGPVDPQTKSNAVPETQMPETQIPETQIPETQIPETQIPETQVPDTSSAAQPGTVSNGAQSYTLARLVMEPDSQRSLTGSERQDESQSLNSVTDAAAEPKTGVREKKKVSHQRKNSGNSKHSPAPEAASKRTPSKSPARKTYKHVDDFEFSDSSTDSFPSPALRRNSVAVKRRAETPGPSSKWIHLFKNAKESKETWPEEESFLQQNSGLKDTSFASGQKRIWSEEETNWLREGVERFGEGKWSKILSFYKFKGRTNINLKDRWRTMKKKNMV